MRLVLRAGKARLLHWADLGHITLNQNGIAILRLPGRRARYVTEAMDELEYFKLVHVEGGVFKLTDYGKQKLREYQDMESGVS